MKKRISIICMCLLLGLITACGAGEKENGAGETDAGGGESGASYTEENNRGGNGASGAGELGVIEDPYDANGDTTVSVGFIMTCRVVDEEDGSLLVAKLEGNAGDVYRLNVDELSVSGEDGGRLSEDEIEEGCLIEIMYDGTVEETFPARFGNILEVRVLEGGFDDLCSLYLDVFEDLWEVDEALNSDITQLGVDLSGTRLSPSEQSAVAWVFGEKHGLLVVQGTWEELGEQGYIDTENLYWEEGCLFSITEEEADGEYSLNTVIFHAEKWRSGLGAYYFVGCTSVQNALGEWGDYQIDRRAIS